MPLKFRQSLIPFLLLLCPFNLKSNILINEFLASNQTGITDQFSSHEDWIEIFNSGTVPVNLEGYFLSDDESNHFLWTFPDTVILPGEFLIVFASGKDIANEQELHTNFRISLEGEPLFLSDADSNLLDVIPATELLTDYSFGRFPDGSSNFFVFETPTPSAPNSQQSKLLGILPEPIIETPAGFYQDSVVIYLSNPVSGAEIRYTLDGSEPNEQSTLYSEPFTLYDRYGEANQHSTIVTSTLSGNHGWAPPAGEIFKAQILRVKLFKDDHVSLGTASTFFVDTLAGMRYDMPVWSIITNHDNFFGSQNGLFVPQNYLQKGFEWERPAYVEFFEEDGEQVLSTLAGVRIHGGASRHYPQKNLRLYARNYYRNASFEYPFFGEEYTYEDKPVLNEFKRLILRNSGNDWPFTLVKDAFLQSLLEGMHVDIQAYRPSVAFINGEFWGIHNIRERQDRFYVSSYYDLDPDRVAVVSRNRQNGQFIVNDGEAGDFLHYQLMEGKVKNEDITDPDVYQSVTGLMSVESFVDHQIANIFFGNTDWPGNNIKYYRYKGEKIAGNNHSDGRWRWMTFDMDFCLGYSNRPVSHNTLAFATAPGGFVWPNPDWSTTLFRRLLLNEDFKIYFVNRFADHMNTRFLPEFVADRIEEYFDRIDNVIPEHIHRWQRPDNYQDWRSSTQNFKNYTSARPDYVYTHIMDYFALSDTFNVTIDVMETGAGEIQFSSLTHHDFPWSGKYFSEVPVYISAIAQDGYKFVEWLETGETSPVLQIVLDKDTHLTAIFQESFEGEVLLPFTYPALHKVCEYPYTFDYWSSEQHPFSYPDNMMFHCQSETNAPDSGTEMKYNYTCAYNLENRPRINGLGVSGFSFLNTGNPQNDESCYEENGWVGAAVLGLSTKGCEYIQLSFTAGTATENQREYKLRLQYKTSISNNWNDFNPFTEYTSSYTLHFQDFESIIFPQYLENRDTVYLRWLYYQSPESSDSGPRAEIRLDNIIVEAFEPDTSINTAGGLDLKNIQLYPNPGNTSFTIDMPIQGDYLAVVRNLLGQPIHEFCFHGNKYIKRTEDWLPGVYFVEVFSKHLKSSVVLKWIKY